MLTGVDYSFIALNTLCLPGFFYHFLLLLRTWGLDSRPPPVSLRFPWRRPRRLCGRRRRFHRCILCCPALRCPVVG